jgi:peptidoglycan/LPS O-acetylase OafA/YrhL
MYLNRDDNRFDILRLFAAWLVLFSHCYPLGGRPESEPLASTLGIDTLGGVGVAIFFVLSGYLITISLERSHSLGDFARRRLLRIYPALIAISLLSVLVLGPLMTTLSQPVYWRHSMTWDYLMTASAWVVKYPLPGVFADNPAPHAINGSLWSLPYEIRCYVVLALLGLVPGSLRLKVSLVAAGLAVLMMVRPPVPPTGPFDKFLGLDYYHTKLGLLFALGAVFACWRERIRPMFLPAALMLVAVYFMGYSAWQLIAYVLGLSTLTLWLALNAKWLPRIPQRVGDWSYGAYLYGFPVQQVLAHFKLHEATFVGYVLTCTVITFALAGLSWHLVEKQALRWK